MLIFVTIQALSLATHPSNSTSLLLLVSLVFKPPPSPSTPVHTLFELEDASPLDAARFRAMNPGMGTAFVELERMRGEAKSKGAEGVALLLVRCGAVVQVRSSLECSEKRWLRGHVGTGHPGRAAFARGPQVGPAGPAVEEAARRGRQGWRQARVTAYPTRCMYIACMTASSIPLPAPSRQLRSVVTVGRWDAL